MRNAERDFSEEYLFPRYQNAMLHARYNHYLRKLHRLIDAATKHQTKLGFESNSEVSE